MSNGTVEYKLKGKRGRILVSLPAYLALLGQRNSVLPAAFEARRDVRRGAVAAFPPS